MEGLGEEDIFRFISNEKNIMFNDYFNNDLFNGTPLISHGTERVSFGYEFNKPMGHYGFGSYLPKSLRILEISGKFNQSVDFLPDGLLTLHFMKNCIFNQIITRWPTKLEVLRFGDNFNSYMSSFPPNLKILEFGDRFNRAINPTILPRKLFTISFGNDFSQYIDDFPDSVENIKLGDNFNLDILYFPKNLKYIEFGQKFDKIQIFDRLPESIKRVRVSECLPNLRLIQEKYNDLIVVKKN